MQPLATLQTEPVLASAYVSKRPVFLPDFGKYLEGLREGRGWKQAQAAALAQRRGLTLLTRQVLLRLESGRTKDIDPDVLREVASLYGQVYSDMVHEMVRLKYGISDFNTAPQPTSVEGFVAVKLRARPIAAGSPLTLEPDERDSHLAFREDVIAKFGSKATPPLCLRVGKKEESMVPTIMPGDVVVIDQRTERRRKPVDGHLYAVNYGPLTGDPGGAIKRVEIADGILILSSDNPDKARFGTKAFNLEGKDLLEILKGEVVWYGRYMGSGKGR